MTVADWLSVFPSLSAFTPDSGSVEIVRRQLKRHTQVEASDHVLEPDIPLFHSQLLLLLHTLSLFSWTSLALSIIILSVYTSFFVQP